MKMTKKLFPGLAVLLLIAVAVTGCSLFGGVSKTDRITLFVAELNSSDRSDVYTHVHPEADDYDALKDGDFVFEGSELDADNQDFSVSAVVEGFDATTGIWTSRNDLDSFTAVMKEDGFGVWKILSFKIGSTTIFD